MINRFILQGYLGQPPKEKVLSNKIKLCNFSIMWSRSSAKGRKTNLFLDCVAWNKVAENVIKYFHKGQEALIEGFLFTEQWTSPNSDKRKATKANVQAIHFCGPKENNYDIYMENNDSEENFDYIQAAAQLMQKDNLNTDEIDAIHTLMGISETLSNEKEK